MLSRGSLILIFYSSVLRLPSRDVCLEYRTLIEEKWLTDALEL